MKKMEIIKGKLVKCTDTTRPNIVAFQVCEFRLNYFGNTITVRHDTIIHTDGRQTVVDGDGFIPHDFDISCIGK